MIAGLPATGLRHIAGQRAPGEIGAAQESRPDAEIGHEPLEVAPWPAQRLERGHVLPLDYPEPGASTGGGCRIRSSSASKASSSDRASQRRPPHTQSSRSNGPSVSA
jgi:hypothetical protein